MDFSKLSTNNQIAAGGGAVALISGLLPWFKVSGFGFSSSASGFSTGILVVLSLLLVAGGVGVLIAKVMEVKDVTVQNLTAEQLAMTLVATGAVFALLRLATKPGGVSFAWGAFVAIIAIGAAMAGTFLSAKDVGVGIPSIDDFKASSDEAVVDARPVGFEAVTPAVPADHTAAAAAPAPVASPHPAPPVAPAPAAATPPRPAPPVADPAPVAATTPPPPTPPVATTPATPSTPPAPVAAAIPPLPPVPGTNPAAM